MRTVWKFDVPVTDAPRLEMPEGARFLSAGPGGHGRLWIWAEVDTSNPPEPRSLRIVGTGNPMPEVGAYIATVQAPPFVWHVYEEPK